MLWNASVVVAVKTIGHSELPFASLSKRIYVLNRSYENELSVQDRFHANQIHFCKTRFATEAQGNSEMACWLNSAKKIGSYTKTFLHEIPYFELMNNRYFQEHFTLAET